MRAIFSRPRCSATIPRRSAPDAYSYASGANQSPSSGCGRQASQTPARWPEGGTSFAGNSTRLISARQQAQTIGTTTGSGWFAAAFTQAILRAKGVPWMGGSAGFFAPRPDLLPVGGMLTPRLTGKLVCRYVSWRILTAPND